MNFLRPRPVLAPPSPWSFPEFVSASLPSGMEVLASHVPGKRLLCAEVLLPNSSVHDPAGKEGLANLAASLLDEGTPSRTAEAFSQALELLGASWYASTSVSGISVGVEAPTASLVPALRLLAEAVTSATVPEREFALVKEQILLGMKNQYASPSTRAHLEHHATLWAPESRYALPGNGSPETLERVTRADVVSLVESFSPAGARLLVAGDLSGLDVVSLAAEAFAGWDRPAPVFPVPVTDLPLPPRLVVVDRPGSVQTELVVGCVTVTRSSPSWSALQVGSHVLGGTLTSRIDALLREERGYTYGMRASLNPRPSVGSWSVSGSVDTPSTLPAVSDLLGLLAGVRSGVTVDEVSAASAYLTGISPLRWETPTDLVRQASGTLSAGLPLSWIDSYLAGMSAATPASVDVALSLLLLEALSFVAVGDAALIGPGLAALTGLPLEVVSE